MYTKNVDLSLLFNEFNLYKVKLLAEIEKFNKEEIESTSKYKYIDTRHKFLLLDCHNKLYCLREDVVHEQILDKIGRDVSLKLNVECVNVNDTLIEEIFADSENSHTFYFLPAKEIGDVFLTMLSYKDFITREIIDLGEIKIDTDIDSIERWRTSIALPIKMVSKSKEDIQNTINKYIVKNIEEER